MKGYGIPNRKYSGGGGGGNNTTTNASMTSEISVRSLVEAMDQVALIDDDHHSSSTNQDHHVSGDSGYYDVSHMAPAPTTVVSTGGRMQNSRKLSLPSAYERHRSTGSTSGGIQAQSLTGMKATTAQAPSSSSSSSSSSGMKKRRNSSTGTMITQFVGEIWRTTAKFVKKMMSSSSAHEWNSAYVVEWFHIIGLSQYAKAVKLSGLNGKVLLEMNEEGLMKELKISNRMHQISFRFALEDLRENRIADYDTWLWTCDRVSIWLASRGLDILVERFRESAVHGGVLFRFTQQDFADELGVPTALPHQQQAQNESITGHDYSIQKHSKASAPPMFPTPLQGSPLTLVSLISAIERARYISSSMKRSRSTKFTELYPPGTGSLHSPVPDWGPKEVDLWLRQLDLKHLSQKFRGHAVHGAFLLILTPKALEEGMGLNQIQSSVISSGINILRERHRKESSVLHRNLRHLRHTAAAGSKWPLGRGSFSNSRSKEKDAMMTVSGSTASSSSHRPYLGRHGGGDHQEQELLNASSMSSSRLMDESMSDEALHSEESLNKLLNNSILPPAALPRPPQAPSSSTQLKSRSRRDTDVMVKNKHQQIPGKPRRNNNNNVQKKQVIREQRDISDIAEYLDDDDEDDDTNEYNDNENQNVNDRYNQNVMENEDRNHIQRRDKKHHRHRDGAGAGELARY